MRLWLAHRPDALAGEEAEGRRGPLPFAGGFGDQSAWLMAAFEIMDTALRRLPRPGSGGP